MFEKEAEERTEEKYACNKREIKSLEAIGFEKGFQEGAEFGYNKANEWHYVKDETPDNENDILCQISKDEVEVGYYHTKQKRYYTIDGQPIDVIRWKEIVLPELKEEQKMTIKLDNLTLNVVCEKSKEGKEYVFTDPKGRVFMSIMNSNAAGNRLVIDLEPFREKGYKVYAFNR